MHLTYTLETITDAASLIRSALHDRTVVALHGEMGAGKTTLVKEICKLYNTTSVVSSPTFAIIHEYQTITEKKIFHIDMYRIENAEEAINAGVEETLYSGELCFVEWPDKAEKLMPPETMHVFIETIDIATRTLRVDQHENSF